ncbi:MAG: replication-associated recombination protein A [Acidobacteriota bacterium]
MSDQADLFGPGGPGAETGPPPPLPERLRPRSLDEVVGQPQLLDEGRFIRRVVDARRLPSLVLWGPPGTGKTTLAGLLADAANLAWAPLSAVLAGVKELRQVVAEADARRAREGRGTLLFVDEIHRFNKAQQDALLPHVERGTVTLVGATTENPSFALVAALLSRLRVVELKALSRDAVSALLDRALSDDERGLASIAPASLEDDARELLLTAADGDARRALSSLEVAFDLAAFTGATERTITEQHAREALQRVMLAHDRDGDRHYDLTSALIKSLRGSDPDAALYWMARLIEGGDDLRFVLRRLVIFAGEDVGVADPTSLTAAVAAMQAHDQIGMPEAHYVLAQACVHLALAPKSAAAGRALHAARQAVRDTGSLPVPLHLRNAPTELAKSLGHGEGYRDPHATEHGVVPDERYLPEELGDVRFFEANDRGVEGEWAQRLRKLRGK